MKLLVTGGNGFIGHNVSNYLASNGHEITSIDIAEPKSKNSKIEYITLDVNDIENINEDFDAILHLMYTTIPSTSNENPQFDVSSNVIAALKLLDYAKNHNAKKFVFLSSGGAVYGNPQYIPIDERHPANPISSYGITKLAIEKYLRLYHSLYNLQTCSIRLSNPYGKHQNPNKKQGIIPIFCSKALNNERIEIYGNGSIRRDFIYIDDVSLAIEKILEYDGQLDEINIGSGIGTTLNQILDIISSVTMKKLDVHYLENRSCDVDNNVLNIQKAQRLLNWNPTIDLYTGIKYLI